MSRQTDLIRSNNSLDSKQFRFTLSNEAYGVHELEYAPDGYLPEQFQFTRSMEYFGVFRKFTQNELKFVKDGRDYLQMCYEAFGVNADVTLKVEALNPNTLLYSDKFTGTIDFSTYKINEIAVEVQVIDGVFIQKILNRESVKVNLLADTSIDGNKIDAITREIITVPSLNVNKNTIWQGNGGYYTDATHIMPVTLIMSEYTEAVTPDATKTDHEAGLFINSLEAYTDLHFRGRINGEMQFEEVQPRIRVQWILSRYNSFGDWQADIVLVQLMEDFVNSSIIDLTFDEIVPIQVDDTLTFKCKILQGVNYNLTYYDIFAELNKVIIVMPERDIYGLLYHEAFERVVAQYTGLKNKVYSELFGRTDIGYETDGTLGAITTGRFIRRIYDVNNSLSTSLKDLFKSLSLYCIGIGEYKGFLRIEPMEYWFNKTVILDISDRIDTETIEKEVIPDLLANSLKIGYNGYEYDRTGGIYEYNTLSEFSTILKIDNSFQLVSAYRADMTGMLKAIAESDPTKDSSADSNIFMLDLVRTILHYKLRTNEGLDYATGGADTEQNYNLLLTPARTIRRWGSYIRAMLDRWQLSFIRWQTSEKSTTLRTRVTGESEVYEAGDIQVKDLNTPLWHPERYIIKAYITRDELDSVVSNPLGIVKLADDKYGWILDFKVQNNDFEVELSLLRVNLQYVTPLMMSAYDTIKFGLLYNGPAVLDVRNISNNDWHVPTQSEYRILRDYYGGEAVAGTHLKNSTGWLEPNDGDNSSKFNANGAGLRQLVEPYFGGLNEWVSYWTSTDEGDPSYMVATSLFNYLSSFDTEGWSRKKWGNPVKVIKDSTTLTHGQSGTYTGNDGKVYRTICIGTQEWLADNLAETKYRNGDLIPEVTDNAEWGALTTGAMCAYNNDHENI